MQVYDDRAAAAGLPQPDSLDVWDLITGADIAVGETAILMTPPFSIPIEAPTEGREGGAAE